jgi:hypothetical protein
VFEELCVRGEEERRKEEEKEKMGGTISSGFYTYRDKDGSERKGGCMFDPIKYSHVRSGYKTSLVSTTNGKI